jgi:hypothetical protein
MADILEKKKKIDIPFNQTGHLLSIEGDKVCKNNKYWHFT